MPLLKDIIKQRTLRIMMKDYIFIIFGITLFAIGYTAFILPERIVSGGVAGIAALLHYAFHWDPAFIIPIVNLGLLAIAFRALSKQFAIRTIIGVALLTVIVALCERIFAQFPLITPGEERFMHLVLGAILSGAGLGLVFAHNGSTGGTDIIVALINKHSRMSIGRALQLTDFTVIASSYLLFQSLEVIVYGIVILLVESYMCDYVINGSRQTVQFMIISKNYQLIANEVNQHMDRGVTILHGQGWYSKQDMEVVMVLCRKYESQSLLTLIKAIDPNAIVSQSFCHGVFGEGFDTIK